MAEDDIIQKVILEADTSKAESDLKSFGQSADQAFKQAGDSANQATTAVNNLSQAASQAGQAVQSSTSQISSGMKETSDSINQTGDAVKGVFGNIGETFKQVGQGLKEGWTDGWKQGAEAAKEGTAGAQQVTQAVKETSDQMNLTRGDVRALSLAFREMGVGELGGLSRLLYSLNSSFGALAVGVAAFAALSKEMFSFAKEASETEEALSRLADASHESIEGASSMQQAFATNGVSAKQFAGEMTNLEEKIRSAGKTMETDFAQSADKAQSALLGLESAQLKYEEAAAKAASADGKLTQAQQDAFNVRSRAIQLEQAGIAVTEAAIRAHEAQANNVGLVAQKYQLLAQGIEVTFDPLTKTETKVKAITDVLAQNEQAFKNMGKGLADGVNIGNESLYKLADILSHVSDAAERAEIGKKLGLTPQTIELLSQGSQALRDLQKHFEDLGVTLDNVDKKNLEDFRKSLNTLGATWDALKEKMGALASPALTSFINGLREGLEKMAPAFEKLGKIFGELDLSTLGKGLGILIGLIAEFVADFINGVRVIRDGISAVNEGADQLENSVKRGFSNLGTAIAAPFVALARVVKEAVSDAVDYVENAFNKAADYADSFVASVEKAFTSVASALREAFSEVFTFVQTTAESIAQAVQGVFQQAAGFINSTFIQPAQELFNQFTQFVTQWAQNIATTIQNAFNSIVQFAIDTFNNVVNTVVGAFDQLVAKAQEIVNQISDFFVGLANQVRSIWASIVGMTGTGTGETGDTGYASGGLVGGKSGTDANLAWLTRGEFVMTTAAVQHWGLGVMQAMNAMQAPRFAAGGLNFSGSAPPGRLAGPVPSMAMTGQRALHLTIEGRSFSGLTIPHNTAKSLERFAVNSQLARTGLKQSWRR